MNLQEIQKEYDLIISLGSSCSPAINMRRYGLRRFAMPLDWMISSSLGDVNRLLSSRFNRFMALENLSRLEETHFFLNDGNPVYDDPARGSLSQSHFIRDSMYNIISAHDFPLIPNVDWRAFYPAYRQKLDRRITRFWASLMASSSILFIRWSASYEQVYELREIVSVLLGGKSFTILILNPSEHLPVSRELPWGMEHVCALEVPNDMNDYANWDYILSGIRLK
ncbi:hypothetical protein R70723_13270 [Paenibacillus sp. FSL R7-0273]|uniref:DUF1796 family putative cysteine peptidase n=1 Tax=Paenibacillus sp. FSL R7-0273 TaxID=1536772 RepID=UPI0004F5987E|nr:DUF1796 family putative cysteine peptidase [Paenibacillus sp. FSL R7-0273]AIQ46732.1 hypothetical protein R70723_13270 [Paenibacillus sp. FSL R7-0273]OMF97499.1 hypothetical protein BK144_02320 [Paenibacillus sp. FSL R7-0273]